MFQVVGAFIAIILGILFFVYLPHDPGDVATDAIFVGFGVLLLKSTRRASRMSTALPQKSGNGPLPQGKKQKKK